MVDKMQSPAIPEASNQSLLVTKSNKTVILKAVILKLDHCAGFIEPRDKRIAELKSEGRHRVTRWRFQRKARCEDYGFCVIEIVFEKVGCCLGHWFRQFQPRHSVYHQHFPVQNFLNRRQVKGIQTSVCQMLTVQILDPFYIWKEHPGKADSSQGLQ